MEGWKVEMEGREGGGQEAGASCTSSFPCSSAGLGYVYAAGSDLLDMLTIALVVISKGAAWCTPL